VSSFQIIIIAILVIATITAVLIFGGFLPGFGGAPGTSKPTITMWGVVPKKTIKSFLEKTVERQINVKYVQKSQDSFDIELIEALASGKGPDIWLMPHELILKHKDKITPISFEVFTERDFKDTFIDEGNLFLDRENQQIIGVPFVIDPLVMYWNKNIFKNAAIPNPPETWDRFVVLSEQLTYRDQTGNIIQSGSALGEFKNINHAKDIFSALILQTGNPIVEPDSLNVTLDERGQNILIPAESALRFFTEFSNPRKKSYSWNKFLPNSKEMFIKESLAMYFGYASELKDIEEKNPHLSFDVFPIPQVLNGKIKATFGKVQAIVVSKNSKNSIEDNLNAVFSLTSKKSIKALSRISYLPPVRKDLLGQKISDPFLAVFYKSAIQARGWLDPEPQKTYAIFENMVESVNTGAKRIDKAVGEARIKLQSLIKKMDPK
jgi:multiple sugar transport system substrate-binding protein